MFENLLELWTDYRLGFLFYISSMSKLLKGSLNACVETEVSVFNISMK